MLHRVFGGGLRASMAKKTNEPPLTGQERLRRVVLLCMACSRNIAYYRAGWNGTIAWFSGELQVTANSNFIDIAILEWCKLFGDTSEEHHWSRILNDIDKRRAFKIGMLAEIGCTRAEWNTFEEEMVCYRNIWAAHVDSKRDFDPPKLDKAIASVSFYHKFLIDRENDGRTYGTLPPDPIAYHQYAYEEGLRFYGRR
jgi:hypothetical protein